MRSCKEAKYRAGTVFAAIGAGIALIFVAYFLIGLVIGVVDKVNKKASPSSPPTITENILEVDCAGKTNLRIPYGKNKINSSSISNGGELESIFIPESVTDIGAYSFKDCKKIKELIIPDSVENLEDGALYGLDALEKLTVHDKLLLGAREFITLFKPPNGSDGDMKIPQNLKEITFTSGFFTICEFNGIEQLNLKGKGTVAAVGVGVCQSLSKIVVSSEVVGLTCMGCENLEDVYFDENVRNVIAVFSECEKMKLMFGGTQELFAKVKYDIQSEKNLLEINCKDGNVILEGKALENGGYRFLNNVEE